MVDTRLPRPLTNKYHDLLREREGLAIRAKAIDQELNALEYALRVLDPEWEPPSRSPKKQRPSRLGAGTVSRECLVFLKEHGDLWAPELATLIAQRRRLQFVDRKEELTFASAVAMALRRYERQGFLETVERHPSTGALKWRIRPDEELAQT